MELEQRLTTLTAKAKEAEDAKGMISRIQPSGRNCHISNVWSHHNVLFLEFLKDSIQVRLDDISKSSKDYGKKIKDLEKEKRTNDLKIQQMEKVNTKLPRPFSPVSIGVPTFEWLPWCSYQVGHSNVDPIYRETIILSRFAVKHYFSR